jgi:Cu-Zn family superoxide dismutase
MFRSGVLALSAVLAAGSLAAVASADTPATTFAAYVVDPSGKPLGTITLLSVNGGTQFRIDLSGLPSGKHGFHVHEFGSCNPVRDTAGKVTVFGAAGGHFDPAATNSHKGPDGGGHAGDLPMLNADYNGKVRSTFYAASVSLSGPNTIVGRSLVIHANPDNYTDTPPNGGSGARIACGEVGPLRAM